MPVLIGIFIIPWLVNIPEDQVTPQIRSLLNKLKEEFTPDALAWWFPKQLRDCTDKKSHQPGVILLLRRPKT